MKQQAKLSRAFSVCVVLMTAAAMLACEEDYDRDLINESKGEERTGDGEEKEDKGEGEEDEEEKHLKVPSSKAVAGSHDGGIAANVVSTSWDYERNGPAHWAEFSGTCGSGHAQSPIDIVSGHSAAMNHTYDLHLEEDVHTHAMVVDNGHSIKVTPRCGGHVSFDGERFRLLQFHFHGKSEHTIDSRRFAMVAHMVHQNPKTKQLVVVAIFFEAGKNNPMLDNILGGIGKEIRIDPQNLLPTDTQHYYHYVGSLTTPPCTENVQWYLLKKPVTASPNQIEAFRRYYVDNERPVQALHDRHVEHN